MKKFPIISVILVLFLTLSVGVGRSYARVEGAVTAASALGTGFTYQGLLKNSGGSPVTSTCNFQFTLWDAASSGAQIGAASTVTGVSVVNGYFTAQVSGGGEFGAAAFNGEARWLQIAVACGSEIIYTNLSPRQPLTPAPYALALPGLYTQPGSLSPNIFGGYSGNTIASGLSGATISGGGSSGFINSISSSFGTVGGGLLNTAGNYAATVGGGYENTAGGSYASVGGGSSNSAGSNFASVAGGDSNDASGEYASMGGGFSNTAAGDYASVGGGEYNIASGAVSSIGGGMGNDALGEYATVPGGLYNNAEGTLSLAAGRYADAANDGAFVWADGSTTSAFSSTANNQFLIKAAGGVGINTNSPSAGDLTVNGQVIAGGTSVPAGAEPFVSEGATSGISLDDRTLGQADRWVVYPNNNNLNFYTGSVKAYLNDSGDLNLDGKVVLGGLGTTGGTALCRNASNEIAYCSSSLRYKDNVAGLTMGLETIAQLRPVTFSWKGTGEPDLGFVAEEVDLVTPLLTTRNADGEIEGVKYDRISAVLVNAVQEQQEQIQKQDKQIADLQAQVKALRSSSGMSVNNSPLVTPWPWLALVVIAVSGMVMFTFKRRVA
jgi:hypothetical protein